MNYVDLPYHGREISNTKGTFFDGEADALSASFNQIWDRKSEERKERSTISSLKISREDKRSCLSVVPKTAKASQEISCYQNL